jgi:hypothetical protein
MSSLTFRRSRSSVGGRRIGVFAVFCAGVLIARAARGWLVFAAAFFLGAAGFFAVLFALAARAGLAGGLVALRALFGPFLERAAAAFFALRLALTGARLDLLFAMVNLSKVPFYNYLP